MAVDSLKPVFPLFRLPFNKETHTMKEFSYPPLLNAKSAEKIVRRLIWRFFKGSIGTKKIRVNGQLMAFMLFVKILKP